MNIHRSSQVKVGMQIKLPPSFFVPELSGKIATVTGIFTETSYRIEQDGYGFIVTIEDLTGSEIISE